MHCRNNNCLGERVQLWILPVQKKKKIVCVCVCVCCERASIGVGVGLAVFFSRLASQFVCFCCLLPLWPTTQRTFEQGRIDSLLASVQNWKDLGEEEGKRNPKVDGLKEIADEVLTFNGKTTVSV